MTCYIFSVISMFFHLKNTSESTNNNTFNLAAKSYGNVYAFDDSKSNLDFNNLVAEKDFLLEKIDTTKSKTIKIKASQKKEASQLNNSKALTKTKEIVTYKIYFDGRIEKHIPKIIKNRNKNKYKYVYIDKQGENYDLGNFRIKKTKKYRGLKGTCVNLINLEEIPKYYKKNNLQYLFKIDSQRSYVNEKTLASFLGAMLEVNYLDISCNGFSHSDGSSKPSKSHINGNNGDFKYLRIDKSSKCGSGTSLNLITEPETLDHVRQNKWNNALHKFGWKNFLGWSYTSKGKKQYLNHIPKRTANHFHHLHIQGYEPNFKEITE